MKIFCTMCGCHFPEDFELTLKAPCNFWGDIGVSNLPVDYKEKIWGWYFSLPTDEIAIKFGIGIGFRLSAIPAEGENANNWE